MMAKRTRARKLCIVLVVSSAVSLCFVTWPMTSPPPQQQQQQQHVADMTNATTKTILMWNEFFGYPHFGFEVGSVIFERHNCKMADCRIWDALDGPLDRPVEDFDLVWFHGLDIPAGTLWRTRPPKRSPHQVYLFYLYESPGTFPFDHRSLHGFFNWTATYRTDSDIYMPYAWISPLSVVLGRHYTPPDRAPSWISPRFQNVSVSMTTKTDIVFWVTSNCAKLPSNRDVYADELARYVKVDVYGQCGTPCVNDTMCDMKLLAKRYKFYLSFENSLCEDYVTEKFFRTMRLDLVPIVYGGANYTKFAPPHSYIDTRDFATPRHLAEYLHYLDSNLIEYRKYFWWKEHYNVSEVHVLCDICEKLHAPKSVQSVDLEGWWNKNGICTSPPVSFAVWVKRAVGYPSQLLAYCIVRMVSNPVYLRLFLVWIFVFVSALCFLLRKLFCRLRDRRKNVGLARMCNRTFNYTSLNNDAKGS